MLSDPEDETTITLVYASRSDDAVLLRTEIDEAARTHPTRFSVRYIGPSTTQLEADQIAVSDPVQAVTVNPANATPASPASTHPSPAPMAPTADNETLAGRIDKPLLQQLLPPPIDGSVVLVCGPSSLVGQLCGPAARDGGVGGAGQGTGQRAPIGGWLGDLGYRAEQVEWL